MHTPKFLQTMFTSNRFISKQTAWAPVNQLGSHIIFLRTKSSYSQQLRHLGLKTSSFVNEVIDHLFYMCFNQISNIQLFHAAQSALGTSAYPIIPGWGNDLNLLLYGTAEENELMQLSRQLPTTNNPSPFTIFRIKKSPAVNYCIVQNNLANFQVTRHSHWIK